MTWILWCLFFNVNSTCLMIIRQNCSIQNIFTTWLLYFCCKSFRKASVLQYISKYWSLKETGRAFVSADIPVKNIWRNMKSSKVGQNQKTFIAVFVYLLSISAISAWKIEHLTTFPWDCEIFQIFPNYLKSQILVRSATREVTCWKSFLH